MGILTDMFHPKPSEVQEQKAVEQAAVNPATVTPSETPTPTVEPVSDATTNAQVQAAAEALHVPAPTIENPDTAPKAIPQVSGTPISEAEAQPAPVTEEPSITPEPQSSLTTEQPSITSEPTPVSQEPATPNETQVPPSAPEAFPTPALEASPVAPEEPTETSPVGPEEPAPIVQPEAPFEPSTETPQETPVPEAIADNKQELLDSALAQLQEIQTRAEQEIKDLETQITEKKTAIQGTKELIEKITGSSQPETSTPEETPVVESTDSSSNTL